jgi:hypothetical protein
LYPSEAPVTVWGKQHKAMADQLTTVSKRRLQIRRGAHILTVGSPPCPIEASADLLTRDKSTGALINEPARRNNATGTGNNETGAD